MEDLTRYKLKDCIRCDGKGWRYITDMSGNNNKIECGICLGLKQMYYSDLSIITIKELMIKRELKFKILNEDEYKSK